MREDRKVAEWCIVKGDGGSWGLELLERNFGRVAKEVVEKKRDKVKENYYVL